MGRFRDISGQKFSRLLVIEPIDKRASDGSVMWRCICDCGNEVIASANNISRGITRSCGCYCKDRIVETHKKYNQISFDGTVGRGITSNTGKEFLFDVEDADKIVNHTWIENDQGYIVTNLGTNQFMRMHRLVLDVNDDELVDHKNRNRADNRKDNLRIATKQLNAVNRAAGKNSKTGIKGVYPSANGNSYVASITQNGKTTYLGTFKTKEEARVARLQEEIRLYGEFAYQEEVRL